MRPNLWEIELRQRELARKAAEEAAEHAAKRPVERSCASCGVFGASFGFGVFRNRSDGMWSCADPQCRAIVEESSFHKAIVAQLFNSPWTQQSPIVNNLFSQ